MRGRKKSEWIYPFLSVELEIRGLSGRQMAQKIGVSEQCFYSWMSGKALLPYSAAVKMADILQYTDLRALYEVA